LASIQEVDRDWASGVQPLTPPTPAAFLSFQPLKQFRMPSQNDITWQRVVRPNSDKDRRINLKPVWRIPAGNIDVRLAIQRIGYDFAIPAIQLAPLEFGKR
jgi:hypothetical protein